MASPVFGIYNLYSSHQYLLSGTFLFQVLTLSTKVSLCTRLNILFNIIFIMYRLLHFEHNYDVFEMSDN